ncbi:hypothetical protein C6P45_004336 [Maudiozyma exigua]|uniref:NUA/TPR/MLP1-2-like domain-containing protein n=1 Tax=Maudiozyma exigua TaxID=34358 RepID=A0A9P7BBU1_MAUEX|nr:hypothetical protein C6P45_004336 [Kazachstania exigua]
MSEPNKESIPQLDINRISSFFNIPKDQIKTFTEDTLQILVEKLHYFTSLEESNIELNARIGQIKTAEQPDNSLQSEIHQLSVEINKVKNQKSELQIQLDTLNREIESAKDIQQSIVLKQDLAKLKETKTELVKILNGKVNEISELKSQLSKISENKDIQNEKYAKIIGHLGENETVRLTLETELEKTKQLLADSERKNMALEDQIRTNDQQFKDYRDSKEKTIERSINDLLSCKNELKLSKEQSSSLSEKYDQLQKQTQIKENEIKDIENTAKIDKDGYDQECKLQKDLINMLEGQIQNFQDKFHEQFGTESEKFHPTEEEYENLVKQLSALRKRLEYSEQERVHLEAQVGELELKEENRGHNKQSHKENEHLQSNIIVLQKELSHERTVKAQLQEQLNLFVSELQKKIPMINSFKDKTVSLEDELTNISLLFEHTKNANKDKYKQIKDMDNEIRHLYETENLLRGQCRHLANQVKYLLINIEIFGNSRNTLSKEEQKFLKAILDDEDINIEDNDSALVISENVEKFRNIMELQQQNIKLLATVDQLTSHAEYLESLNGKFATDSKNEIIHDAKEAILALEARNGYLEKEIRKLESGSEPRKLITEKGEPEQFCSNQKEYKETIEIYKEKIQRLKAELKALQEKSSTELAALRDKVEESNNKYHQVKMDLEMEKSNNELLVRKSKILENSVHILQTDKNQLLQRNEHLNQILSSNDEKISKLMKEYVECKSELSSFKITSKNMKSEKDMLIEENDNLKTKFSQVTEEKNQLKVELAKHKANLKEILSTRSAKQSSYEDLITNLEEQLVDLRKKLTLKNDETNDAITARNSEVKWFKFQIGNLNKENDTLRKSLADRSESIAKITNKSKELEEKLINKDITITTYEKLLDEQKNFNVNGDLENKLSMTQQSLENSTEETRKLMLENEETRGSYENLSLRHKEILKELDNLKSSSAIALETTTKSNTALQETIDTLKSDIEQQKASFEKRTDEYNVKLSELQDIVSSKNVEKHQAELVQLSGDLQNEKERSADLERKYEALLLSQSKEQSEEVQETNKELEAKCKVLTEQIISSQNEISRLRTELINTTENSEQSTETPEDNRKEIQELQEHNAELQDRFNRLKRQANDKLHSAKTAADLLEEEHRKLKIQLDEETSKRSALEKEMQQINSNKSNDISELQRELEFVKIHSKEIEYKLNETMEKSNELIEKLNVEIDTLKAELEEAKMSELNTTSLNDEQDDYSKALENMRKTYEDEKLQLAEDHHRNLQELEEKLRSSLEEYDKLKADKEEIPNLESLKKEWQDSYEETVLSRIEQAQEDLKKSIRLPTEERINQMVKDRTSELNKEFHDKVEEKARELIDSGEFSKIKDEIKLEAQKELETSFAENLENTKKKSFEEGQHQASMKVTLLQRKISSLESKLDTEKEVKNEPPKVIEVGDDADVTVENENVTNSQVSLPLKSELEPNMSLTAKTPSPFKFGVSPFMNKNETVLKTVPSATKDVVNNPFSMSFESTGSSPSALNPFNKFKPTFSFGNLTNQNDITESSENSTPNNKRAFDDEEDDDESEKSTESKKQKEE